MGVDDAELFQLEAAVRALLPPAVLLAISSSGSSDNSSSSTVTPPVAADALESGSAGLDKHTSEGKQGTIQLTAVACLEG